MAVTNCSIFDQSTPVAGTPHGGRWRIGPSIKRSVGGAGKDVNGSKRRHVAQVNFVHAGRGSDYWLSGIGRSRPYGLLGARSVLGRLRRTPLRREEPGNS